MYHLARFDDDANGVVGRIGKLVDVRVRVFVLLEVCFPRRVEGRAPLGGGGGGGQECIVKNAICMRDCGVQ